MIKLHVTHRSKARTNHIYKFNTAEETKLKKIYYIRTIITQKKLIFNKTAKTVRYDPTAHFFKRHISLLSL